MDLRRLLSRLEQNKWSQQDLQETYPSHLKFNNGNGFGYVSGNSTSFFDNPGTGVRQRSLKFGEGNAYDRPRQGFSREPFIGKNKDIPDLDKGPSRL